jgi:hypothetical protein
VAFAVAAGEVGLVVEFEAVVDADSEVGGDPVAEACAYTEEIVIAWDKRDVCLIVAESAVCEGEEVGLIGRFGGTRHCWWFLLFDRKTPLEFRNFLVVPIETIRFLIVPSVVFLRH